LQVPKPDIVITSYEAAAADAPALKAIAWEVVLLDERQRGRAGLAKVSLCTRATALRAC
jgi:SNF2 family DNA or RNA helicase